MAPRQMKIPEKTEAEPEEHFSQRKRPELGRYLLQVDGQTKGSYQTAESAESAGLAIKKEYPILHVTVYDSVDFASTVLGSSARQSERTFERAQAATLISDRVSLPQIKFERIDGVIHRGAASQLCCQQLGLLAEPVHPCWTAPAQ